MEQIAKAINQLGMFCGKRDVEKLITEHLQETYGIKRAGWRWRGSRDCRKVCDCRWSRTYYGDSETMCP